MNILPLIVMGCAVLPLTSCVSPNPNSPMDDPPESETVLFEDSMTADWRENWFLDGEKAVLEHCDDGLMFHAPDSGLTSETKNRFRDKFDSHHAVLWSKEEFEGDIRIRYEWHPLETGWANLVYIQAQGIGAGPYAEDISQWRDLRKVASMDKYFNYMNLLSLSLRREIRCKRYPWNDLERDLSHEDTLVEPMVPHAGLEDGKRYRVEIEKRKTSCRLAIHEVETGRQVIDYTWDLSNPSPERRTPYVEKGRIGLRQMGGNKVIFRDFKVTRLPEE